MDTFLFQCILISIHDLLVYSKSLKEHLQQLGKGFERLRKINIKLRPKNSELVALKISRNGVSFDSAYLKELQSSLGQKRLSITNICLELSTGLHTSTILDYARNVAPLQELLRSCQGQAKSAKASKLSRLSSVHGDTWMAAASRRLSLTESRCLILRRTMRCACLKMQVEYH